MEERPEKKGAVAGLPDDPLVEVLSRVPARDLHRSKCVSKFWRDLIADPLHRKKFPQTLQGFFPCYRAESVNEYGGSFINLVESSPPPVDPSFPFLTKLPDIHKIWLQGSCNGLLLFRHATSLSDLGYIVFNPATEQWAAVPSTHTPVGSHCRLTSTHTRLVFHPAVSSYFHLVVICAKEGSLATMHIYSSKTGVWRHNQIDWDEEVKWLGHWKGCATQITGLASHAAIFSSMLYLILEDDQIAEIDLEGKVQRIIPAPPSVGRQSARPRSSFIGQSQGCLHCITEEMCVADIPSELSSRVYTTDEFDDDCDLISIWVLEDYDTKKWVLKHSVSPARLFGAYHDCNAVAIHPDGNLVFIFLYQKQQLISYGLDSKEVLVVGTTKERPLRLTPYVPCFMDFSSIAEHEEHKGLCQGR